MEEKQAYMHVLELHEDIVSFDNYTVKPAN
jgi:hypothetical protein